MLRPPPPCALPCSARATRNPNSDLRASSLLPKAPAHALRSPPCRQRQRRHSSPSPCHGQRLPCSVSLASGVLLTTGPSHQPVPGQAGCRTRGPLLTRGPRMRLRPAWAELGRLGLSFVFFFFKCFINFHNMLNFRNS
jgi:hypothetical protein